MKTSEQIVLAVESGIRGGSLSLLSGDTETAHWIGDSSVSRAEDLLFSIDELLTGNGTSRDRIDLIAVSAGPGSFTGIRIGIATALGLKAGLGIELSSQSALRAMAAIQTGQPNVTAAVPSGRNTVCLQRFKVPGREPLADGEPYTLSEVDFAAYVNNENDGVIAFHSGLVELVEPKHNTLNFGANVAYAIGLICRDKAGVVEDPLFISKSF